MDSTGQKLLAVRILPKQTINLNPHLNGQVLISMSLFSGGVGKGGGSEHWISAFGYCLKLSQKEVFKSYCIICKFKKIEMKSVGLLI